MVGIRARLSADVGLDSQERTAYLRNKDIMRLEASSAVFVVRMTETAQSIVVNRKLHHTCMLSNQFDPVSAKSQIDSAELNRRLHVGQVGVSAVSLCSSTEVTPKSCRILNRAGTTSNTSRVVVSRPKMMLVAKGTRI